jgi:hypothetical protein
MKVISFSLWGNNERYFYGALRNCEISLKLYPEWLCFFYISSETKDYLINPLQKYPNCRIIRMENIGEKRGLFWRFLAAFDKEIDITIVRDCDSRITEREVSAVNQWIDSNKGFHIMRDHPYHNTEILGGMWGVKNKIINLGTPLTLDSIKEYKDAYQEDQKYLREKIWPLVKDNCMIHDEFFKGISFPHKRRDFDDFVGQQYDETDLPVKENSEILKDYLSKK